MNILLDLFLTFAKVFSGKAVHGITRYLLRKSRNTPKTMKALSI